MKVSEQLRKSILQAAIQGKLTEQLESDGSAHDLLQEIQAEKERLIKDKVIKKSKPLAPITDEEIPFDIPENWEWVKLGEYTDVRDGTHDTPKYQEFGIPLITSKNLINGEVSFENVKYISEKDFEDISLRSHVDDGDILFAMIGSIGNPVIVKKHRDFSIKNVALIKPLKYSKETCNMRYILLYLKFIEENWKSNASGAVQSFISLTFIRNSIIPIPPLAEQQRIVERIEELLPELDKLKEQEEIASKADTELPEKLRKSFLQAAMQGELTEQLKSDGSAIELLQEIKAEKEQLIKDKKIKKEKPLAPITEEDIPFDIPENWSWVRLGEVATSISSGGTPSRSISEYWSNGNIPWLKIGDLKSKYVTESSEFITEKGLENSSAKIFSKGTILFTIFATIGDCAILEFDATTNQAIAGISIVEDKIFSEYLYYVLLSLKDVLIGKGRGMAQLNINQKILKDTPIPIPPYLEQQRIAEKLDILLEEIDMLAL